jgi:hypothetical protein
VRRRSCGGPLRDATLHIREEPDGYAYEYPEDAAVFRAASEWISLERRCCPFLSFELRWPSGEHRPSLRLSGPSGVKEFLKANFHSE